MSRVVVGSRTALATRPRPRNQRLVTAVFFAGVVAVVAGVLLEVFPRVLPHGLAARIGHNSEGFVLALLLALWIQLAHRRLAPAERVRRVADGRFRRVDDADVATRWRWPVTLGVAVGCLAVALLLLASDLPSRFRTLNETFLAAAVLIPYLQIRRPLPGRLAVWLALGVLAVIVFGQRTEVVTLTAETLGVLLLAPVAFDLVDRGILDPDARTSPRVRWGWYALLVLVPMAFSVLHYGVGVDGLPGEATRYAVRTTEAFLGLLLVELYFAVGLGRTGRTGSAHSPD